MANSASASSCADEYSFVSRASVTNSPPLSQSSTSTEVVPAGSRYRLDMIRFARFMVASRLSALSSSLWSEAFFLLIALRAFETPFVKLSCSLDERESPPKGFSLFDADSPSSKSPSTSAADDDSASVDMNSWTLRRRHKCGSPEWLIMLAVRRIKLICWYRPPVLINALTGRPALQLRTAAAASALLRVRPSIVLTR